MQAPMCGSTKATVHVFHLGGGSASRFVLLRAAVACQAGLAHGNDPHCLLLLPGVTVGRAERGSGAEFARPVVRDCGASAIVPSSAEGGPLVVQGARELRAVARGGAQPERST